MNQINLELDKYLDIQLDLGMNPNFDNKKNKSSKKKINEELQYDYILQIKKNW